MQLNLFRKKGFLYIPRTFAGWAIAALCLAFSICIFLDAARRQHSVNVTLALSFFYFIMVLTAYSILGWLTSQPAETR